MNYKEILTECFSTDSDLLKKWHIEAPSDLETCVNRTNNDLLSINNMNFVLLKDNKDSLIGFYGTEMGCYLTTFFIKPEYRNKEVIKKFWKQVEKDMTKEYYSGLYAKNTRAIEFLKKNGGRIYSQGMIDNNPTVVFIFNKGELCL